MALTYTISERTVLGNKQVVIADVDLDDSYPTGGEVLTAGKFGLMAIENVFISNPCIGSYLLSYDPANKKIKAFSAIGTEVVATTDLSAVTDIRVMVIGY